MSIANLFSQNLIVNGDFTSGNSAFTSDYTYIPINAASVQKIYGIVTNPSTWEAGFSACGDHTNGTGNMMVIDGSNLNAGNDKVWSKTVAVTPGEDYLFQYWVQSVSTSNPAKLETEINGVSLGTPITAPAVVTCGNWQLVSAVWNSGVATSAVISLYDREINVAGNNFAIDDLSFILLPTATISGTTSVCQNGTSPSVTLTGANGTPPYTFTYNINGGANIVVSSVGASSAVNVAASSGTVGTFNYNLVSVAYGVTPTISNNQSGTATVTVKQIPTVAISGTTTICSGSTGTVTFTGSPNAIITYNINGGTNQNVVLNASGIASVTNIYSANAVFNLVSAATGGSPNCSQSQSGSATITVNTRPDAGLDQAPITVCDSSASPIDLFSLITGEQSGGTWTRTGTGGTFNAPAGLFTPAPGATNSTFTYTVPGTFPCVDDTSIVVININPQPDAGMDGSTTVCDPNSAVPIDLFGLITGEQSGGVWIRSTGTGGTFNAAAGTFTPLPNATSSTFTYTLTGTSPCIDDSSIATVNVASASISGPATILAGQAATLNFIGTPGAVVHFGSVQYGASGNVPFTASVTLNSLGQASYNIPYLSQTTTFNLIDIVSASPPCTRLLTGGATVTVNLNTCAVPLVQVNIDVPATVCNPGECTDLLAHYSNIGSTTDYTVSSIPYCPSFPFTGGTAINANCDDVWAPTVSLPFQFNFYGTCYNQVLVGSNGVLTFDLVGPPYGAGGCGLLYCNWPYSATIPNPTFPIRNAIYGVYQDTNINNPPVTNPAVQNVNYYVLSTGVNAPPNRVFVANFNELPQFSCDGSVGFQTSQVVIHETTNIIEIFVNKRTSCTTWNSGSGLIGIQNQAGTKATVPPGRNTGTWSATNEAWRFYPKDIPVTPTEIRWEQSGSPIGSINENPLHICPTGSATYTAIVKYDNCGITEVRKDINVDVAAPLSPHSPHDITICNPGVPPYTVNIDENADIFNGIPNPTDFVIKYYENLADANNDAPTNINYISDADLATFTFNTLPKTIYVRIQDLVTTGCANIRTFTILPATAPAGTISYGASSYCDTYATPILVTENTLSPGGTYSATPAGLNLDTGTGDINPGSADGSYTVTYSIPASPPCPAYATSATVAIVPCTCAVIASSTSQTLCENTLLTGITYSSASGATSAAVSGTLPIGVTGNFSGGVYTVSGTPTATGIYNYTVTLTTSSGSCSASTTITVNPQPNAGTAGTAATVCDSSTAPINLFNLINGEQPGGTWTRNPGGTGGTFNAAAGTFTPAAGATTSTFTYTITATAPCTDATSIATVNINAQPDAGTANPATTVCDSSTTPIDLFSLVTGEQTGGTWTRNPGGTGGTFNATAGTFTPAPGATTSTFTYTLTGTAPCVNSSSTVTININALPNAGTAGTAATVCDSSTAPINLFNLINGEQSGGTWTRNPGGTGGTFNAVAGTFTPAAGATTSTFTYTIAATAPCPNATSIATVNINAQPDAGTANAPITICDSSTTPIDLFSLVTGEQTGGTWTRNVGGTGGTFNASAGTFTAAPGATSSTFTYTLTGTAPCVNSASTVTININPQPNAGTAGTAATVCDSSTAPINLFDLINGEQLGGTWTRNTGGTGGTFNAAAGTFTPAPGATTSTFTYTLTATAPCTNSTSIATVNINPQPNAGTAGTAATVCDSSTAPINLFNLINGEQPGGTWTRNPGGTGGTFNAAAGTFTPAPGATTSTFTYTITATAPCTDATSIATVNINAQPDAGTANPATTICDSSTTPIDLFSLVTGEQTGGTWTRNPGGTGGTFNATAGTFTPAPGATTSTFTYTLTGTAPCVNSSSTVTININALPNAGTAGTAATVCDSSTAPINLFNLINGEQSGGTWTRNPGGTGGTFNAVAGTFTPAAGATTSTFTYTIAATAPCPNATSIATVNINAQPDAGTANAPITICDSSTTPIDLFSLVTGEQTGGTWTRNVGGTGGTFNASAGTFTAAPGATSSTFTYTLTGTAPCVNSASTVTININPQPNAGTAGTAATVCDSSTAPINLFDLINGEQLGGTWTRNTGGTGGTFNAAAGTFTPAPGATTSTFTYTLTATAPCTNSTSIATVNINPQPNAGTNGPSITICDNSSTPIDLFSLITGEQAGGTWTRNTGGTGGTFDAAAGTFTPAPGATSSTFTYTVNATAPCTAVTNIATVNINPQRNAGGNGSITICDSDNAAINLFGLITGTPQSGGTWTRNPGGTGGIFNAVAGTYTPAPGATTSTFTYTLTGTAPCANATSQVIITINPKRNAGIANPTPTIICDSSTAAINLFNLITGEEAGGTWTRETGNGGTFDATAGTFIPLGATSSKFLYVLTGTAPCINASSEATITVFPQPVAGNDGSRIICETDSAVINLFDIITGEQPGGIWTRTGGNGGIFNAAAGTFTSAVGATSSTFKYTIIAAAPCIDDSSVATVTINPAVTIALTSGNGNQTVCINSPLQTSVYTVGNGATGAAITAGGLPGGVTGLFDATTGKFTVSGTPTMAGNFNYSIEASGTCPGTPISGHILVNPRVTMILDSAASTTFQTPCDNTSITQIRYLVGSGATGAVATGLPPGVTANFNALNNIFTISGIVNTVGTYNYTVHTVGGCGPDVSLTGTIQVIQNVTIALNSPTGTDHQVHCIDTQIANIIYEVDNGATGASIVSGSVPTGIQGSFSGGFFTLSGIPTQAGEFTYTVTTTGGCSTASLTGTIVVNPLPVIAIDGGYICVDEDGNPKPGSTFVLDTRLIGNYTFVWSDANGVISGQNGSTYEATAPGVYSVQVTNNYTLCSSSASVTVVPSYPPVKVEAVATDYFADQQQIAVSVIPLGNYEYQLDNGAFQDSNQFVGFDSGYHTITVRDKFMCGFKSTTILIIDFPKFFTPNGDGFNDTWNIEDVKFIDENSTIYIFDRYGKLVKEISPLGSGWDGTMNNHMLPATDYWFKILYIDKGVSKEFRSHFALKR